MQISLSIATAAASTLGPGVGDVERFEQALRRVPSSPNGPWRTGNATSQPSSPPAGRISTSSPAASPAPVARRSAPRPPRARRRAGRRRPRRRSAARPRARTTARLRSPPPSSSSRGRGRRGGRGRRSSWWCSSWSSVGLAEDADDDRHRVTRVGPRRRPPAPARARGRPRCDRSVSCSITSTPSPAAGERRPLPRPRSGRRRRGSTADPAPLETTIVTVSPLHGAATRPAAPGRSPVPSGSSASRVSTFGISPSLRSCDSADLLLVAHEVGERRSRWRPWRRAASRSTCTRPRSPPPASCEITLPGLHVARRLDTVFASSCSSCASWSPRPDRAGPRRAGPSPQAEADRQRDRRALVGLARAGGSCSVTVSCGLQVGAGRWANVEALALELRPRLGRRCRRSRAAR